MAIAIFIFLMFFAIVTLVISLGLRFLEGQKRKKVTEMLESAASPTAAIETKVLMEPRSKSRLDDTLESLNLLRHLTRQIQQAGLNWTPTGLLAQMLLLGLLGGLIGFWIHVLVFPVASAAGLALLFAALPYLFVLRRRRKRMGEFEQQFPEALDFLARAMRAGHAFSISMEMLSDEAPQPLGLEFRKVFNEQNLGLPIETSLENLVARMPLLDVRFFVSAVLLQRETGGNLSEILTKLGRIIRERFQLKGQVRAASAHGRITGTILTLMPVVLMLGLMVVAPDYLPSMARDSDGKYLIVGAILALLLGHYCIRRIIDIKV